jgi:hypothetical protein
MKEISLQHGLSGNQVYFNTIFNDGNSVAQQRGPQVYGTHLRASSCRHNYVQEKCACVCFMPPNFRCESGVAAEKLISKIVGVDVNKIMTICLMHILWSHT